MMAKSATVYEYRDRIAVLETQLDRASLERQTFVDHLARQERRNELLQDALDDAVERVSGLQAQIMDLAADNTRLLAAVGAASVAVVAVAASASAPADDEPAPRRGTHLRRVGGIDGRRARFISRLRPVVAILPEPFSASWLATASGCSQAACRAALTGHPELLGVVSLPPEEWPAAKGRRSPFYRRAEVAATA
jgi:hypothetical protein